MVRKRCDPTSADVISEQGRANLPHRNRAHVPSSTSRHLHDAPLNLCPQRVHLITCETRTAETTNAFNATVGKARDIQKLSFDPLRYRDGFVVRNLCEHQAWPNKHFGLKKVSALSQYASQLALSSPNDLIIFSDSDVLLNERAITVQSVLSRYELARRRSEAIIFQAEPWCFAPFRRQIREKDGNRSRIRQEDGTVCPPGVLRQYERRWGRSKYGWRCPRYLNSGLFAGSAGAIARLTALWEHPQVWLHACAPRKHHGADDQCIATMIALMGNVTIELDVQEWMFATAGTAVMPLGSKRQKHYACLKPKSRHGRLMYRHECGTGNCHLCHSVRPPPENIHNSTPCADCGRVTCDCSGDFDWRRHSSMAGLSSWHRPATLKLACGLGDAAPMLIRAVLR